MKHQITLESWVSVKNKPVQVTSISNLCIYYSEKDDPNLIHPVRWEDVEPIPMSKEWAEVLQIRPIIVHRDYVVYDINGWAYLDHRLDIDDWHLAGTTFKYVHQIQALINMLRGNGER